MTFKRIRAKYGPKSSREERSARRSRLKKYRLSQAGFDALFASQDNRCAICQSPEHSGRGWNVDHDHVTGQVRSILCALCNAALGMLRESPGIALAAERYLQRWLAERQRFRFQICDR